MGTGSAELLEIQRAAEFGNILWLSSVALVLHSGTPSRPGSPSAFLYSRLCAGTQKVPHLSPGSDLDSAGVQVIPPKQNYCLALVVSFAKLVSSPEQSSIVFRLSDRKLETIQTLQEMQSVIKLFLEFCVILLLVLSPTCIFRID